MISKALVVHEDAGAFCSECETNSLLDKTGDDTYGIACLVGLFYIT